MEKGESSVKEIEERWARIRLEEEEEDGVLVYGEEEKWEEVIDTRWCLVGRLLT